MIPHKLASAGEYLQKERGADKVRVNSLSLFHFVDLSYLKIQIRILKTIKLLYPRLRELKGEPDCLMEVNSYHYC